MSYDETTLQVSPFEACTRGAQITLADKKEKIQVVGLVLNCRINGIFLYASITLYNILKAADTVYIFCVI